MSDEEQDDNPTVNYKTHPRSHGRRNVQIYKGVWGGGGHPLCVNNALPSQTIV